MWCDLVKLERVMAHDENKFHRSALFEESQPEISSLKDENGKLKLRIMELEEKLEAIEEPHELDDTEGGLCEEPKDFDA
ncbi:hypothetical protein LINPERPRIM_LOCUS14829, partial [Linum perenne]